MTRRAFFLGVLTPVLAVRALTAQASKAGKSRKPRVQRGLASWYGHGDGLHGKRTASGAVFDKNALTAAHFDLPFGTRVRVRNLRNNRRVDLTITDRFPKETLNRGRIVDVSYGAARKLRMVEARIVPVELTVRA